MPIWNNFSEFIRDLSLSFSSSVRIEKTIKSNRVYIEIMRSPGGMWERVGVAYMDAAGVDVFRSMQSAQLAYSGSRVRAIDEEGRLIDNLN
jgi:hypothetical protein